MSTDDHVTESPFGPLGTMHVSWTTTICPLPVVRQYIAQFTSGVHVHQHSEIFMICWRPFERHDDQDFSFSTQCIPWNKPHVEYKSTHTRTPAQEHPQSWLRSPLISCLFSVPTPVSSMPALDRSAVPPALDSTFKPRIQSSTVLARSLIVQVVDSAWTNMHASATMPT